MVSDTIFIEKYDPKIAQVTRMTTQSLPPRISNLTAAAKVELAIAGLNIRAELIATLTRPFVVPNDGPVVWSFIIIILNLKGTHIINRCRQVP